ncbi:hypothetical protein FDN13_06855 [Caloramator sp. E03]|uniref:hypothetical protein n=1 Tax=Caloramator sp. E03 TaxID=2576307 RepID=UPI0011101DF1|nr:hypothetical protein [Caloramator sp. E03]QCX33453.1 hypothetical protein FDN13_06855 [Caloramator sp. E03]
MIHFIVYGFIYFIWSFFNLGDNLKNFKAFLIFIVFLFSFLSLLYLSFIALRIQRYSFSNSVYNINFILYSKTKSYKINSALKYAKDKMDKSYCLLTVLNSDKDEEIESEILSKIRYYDNYIVLEFNESSILDKDTILISVDKENVKELQRAQKLKKNLLDKKVNILNNMVNKKAYSVIKLEISKNNNLGETEDILLKALYSLIE